MYASRNATEARDHSCLVFVRGIKNTAISGRYDGILRVTTHKSGREGLLSLRNPRRGNLRLWRYKRHALTWNKKDSVWESSQSGRRDLNSGLLAPHASALPGCATPR